MKPIGPNDDAQNALMKAAEELKKDPSAFIARLMQFSDTVLEKKLDVARQQKTWAYEQEKRGSFELLHVKEDLIIKIRLMKSENETEAKPKRKPRKKKISEERTEEFQTNSGQTDNFVTAHTTVTEDKPESDKQKDEHRQLTLDF